jgi:hypothetical protein
MSQDVIQNGSSSGYFITAVADSGSAISPAGKATVQKGGNKAFCFSADPGYSITAVLVDGVPLSKADIAKGCYTFSYVNMNHTIEVKSTEADAIILTVDVVLGKGRAEFSLNGGPFQTYVTTVLLPKNSSLVLVAYADAGYRFVEWRTGETTFSEPELYLGDIVSSSYVQLCFANDKTVISEDEDNGGHTGIPWWVVVLGLLIVSGILLWFIFYRRYYKVYIGEYSHIIGNDIVHRKSDYSFTVEGGFSSAIYYRIGEDGQWVQLFPDEDGTYTIPGKEVRDDIYLERGP